MLACTVISRPSASCRPARHTGGRRRPQPRRPSLARAPAVASAEAGKQDKEAREPSDTAGNVLVQFRLQRRVPFGQELLVVGDAIALGAWDCEKAVLMAWHEGDVWEAHVELPAHASVEFKFVQQVPNCPPVWESCLNRTLAVPTSALDVDAVWCYPLATVYHDHAISATASEAESEANLSEEDVSPPFRPSEALAKFTEVVQASLDAFSSGSSTGSSNGSPSFDAGSTAAATNGSSPSAAKSAGAAPKAASSANNGATSDPLAAAAAQARAPAAPSATEQSARHALAAAVAQDVLAADQPALAAAAAAAPEQDSATDAAVPAVAQDASGKAASKAADAGKAEAEGAGGKGGKGATVVLPAKAEAAVGEIIDAATAADAPPAPAEPKGGGGPSLKTLTQVAGSVALGVAAVGVMGALAIDITDAAVLGAVTAGAAAALNTPSASGKKAASSRRRASKASASDTESESEVSAGEEAGAAEKPVATIASKPSAPGVILAAGVLSAIDAGRKILADSSVDEADAAKPATSSKVAPAADGKAGGKPKP